MRYRVAGRNLGLGLALLAPLLLCNPEVEHARALANDQVARGVRGAVVSAEPHATRVGLDVLKSGGNAVDAAIAVFATLAVTLPQAGNLGGGGFMLVRMADGNTVALDFRERAPASASRDMYLREDGSVHPNRSLLGVTASGVPGSPAGLAWLQDRYGTRPLNELVEPAIRLAGEGFEVSHFLASSLRGKARSLARFPSTRAIFFKDGRPLKAGERLVQPDLAATLERLAEDGRDGFYKGRTAELLVAQMRRDGGLITAKDLASYVPLARKPVRGMYRGYEVLSMPPPSSGGIALVQMLNLLESHDLRGMGFGSSRAVHVMTEAMRRAYADRARWLGDADFYPVPTKGLVSKEYAAKLGETLSTERVSEVAPGRPPGAREGEDTTHFSVIDAVGNAVSCTTTINSSFGSCLVVEGAGFFLNNEMDDFSSKPGVPNQFGLVGGEANAIEPGKRMLSSMTPTIVLRADKPRFVLGSPGGGRIINTVLQVLVNAVDHRMSIDYAVRAPRIHHQWKPETLAWERLILSEDVRAKLGEMGHSFAKRPSVIGRCQAIEIRPDGTRVAAADPRSGGAAMAY